MNTPVIVGLFDAEKLGKQEGRSYFSTDRVMDDEEYVVRRTLIIYPQSTSIKRNEAKVF